MTKGNEQSQQHFNNNYYRKKEYMEKLSNEDLILIYEKIDRELVKELNYEFIN